MVKVLLLFLFLFCFDLEKGLVLFSKFHGECDREKVVFTTTLLTEVDHSMYTAQIATESLSSRLFCRVEHPTVTVKRITDGGKTMQNPVNDGTPTRGLPRRGPPKTCFKTEFNISSTESGRIIISI